MTAILTSNASHFSLFGSNPSNDVDKKPTRKKVDYSVVTTIGGDYLLSVIANSVPDKKGNSKVYFTVTISDNFDCVVRIPFIESKVYFNLNNEIISNLAYEVARNFVSTKFANKNVNPELYALIMIIDLFSVNYDGDIKSGFTLRHSLPKIKTLQAWSSLMEYAVKTDCLPLMALAEYANEMLGDMGDMGDPDPVANDTQEQRPLADFTLADLKLMAKEYGITVNKPNKNSLIAAIEDHLTKPESEFARA